MTVTMEECLISKRQPRHAIFMGAQKLSERLDQCAQSPCPRIVGEQVGQLVPENRDAAWLETDDWHTLVDLAEQRADDVAKLLFCLGEHSVVIERASAAQPGNRNLHREAGVLQ